VEFASIFHRFGAEVTVVEMLPRIVPVEDEDISKELERVFRKQKIRVETGARADDIRKTGQGVTLTLTTKDGKQEQLEPKSCLVAVGRSPTRRASASNIPRWSSIAASSRSTPYQQTAEPGVTPSATWWRALLNWRMSPPWKVWSRWRTWPASPPSPSTRTASPAAPTPSRESAAWG